MDTAVRTLPIRTEPIETEALDSWLQATSHRLSSTWDDFTEAVGLRRRGRHRMPNPTDTRRSCRHQRGHRAPSRSTV